MHGIETNLNGLFSLRLSGERDLFGLAPGGVYQATPIAQGTGELLPHLFTLTLWNRRTAIPQGGMFSVALSLSRNPAFQDSGTVRVTDHPALRSSDFPLLPTARLYGPSKERPSVPRQLPLSFVIFAGSPDSVNRLLPFPIPRRPDPFE